MALAESLRQIQTDGFCIIKGVIPPDQVEAVSQSIIATQAANSAAAEAALAKTRAKGHRVGAAGVGSLRQIINYDQSFAPYLANTQLMALTDALFGPYCRISCTDCVINHPGNERGYWHADWPYNATNASHIPAPYPDALLHLSTIWMLTPFSPQTGGTWVVPGSHRHLQNPAAGTLATVDQDAPYPGEMQVTGAAGDVLAYDSRLWHAVASNASASCRVALIVRYAPWWLNLTPTMIGMPDHSRMVVETGGKNYESPPLKAEVFHNLPADVQPLYRHWTEAESYQGPQATP